MPSRNHSRAFSLAASSSSSNEYVVISTVLGIRTLPFFDQLDTRQQIAVLVQGWNLLVELSLIRRDSIQDVVSRRIPRVDFTERRFDAGFGFLQIHSWLNH